MPWSAKARPPQSWANATAPSAAFNAASKPALSWGSQTPRDGHFDPLSFDQDSFDTGLLFVPRTATAPSWGQAETQDIQWTSKTPPPPSWATE